tara:strand:- start:407 stop:589 length:183 start_codon:yes stop_codon:yes gene_type:complete
MNTKIINELITQLKNTIEDSTQYLTEDYASQSDDNDLGIHEGRLELAQELLNYIEENNHA